MLADRDILDFFTHPFHGKVSAPIPTIWEPPIVLARMIEATIVLAGGRVGPKSYGNGWPQMSVTWDDIASRGAEAHRKAVWADWANKRADYSSIVYERAEQAAAWPVQHLQGHEQLSRALLVIVAAKAARVPIKRAIQKAGYTEPTARRHQGYALKIITKKLNDANVRVREAQITTSNRRG